jgi:hypothetical protein
LGILGTSAYRAKEESYRPGSGSRIPASKGRRAKTFPPPPG